jgi:hypothetical protein
MNKHAIIIAALCLCILPATQAQAESDHKSSALRISITKLDVGDKTLKLSYELRNDSPEDVWILVGHHLLGEYVLNADVFMAEDNRTLARLKGSSQTCRSNLHLHLKGQRERSKVLNTLHAWLLSWVTTQVIYLKWLSRCSMAPAARWL